MKTRGTYISSANGLIPLTQIPYTLDLKYVDSGIYNYTAQPNDIVAIQICNSDPYKFITLQDSSHNLLWADPFHDGLFVYTMPSGINS